MIYDVLLLDLPDLLGSLSTSFCTRSCADVDEAATLLSRNAATLVLAAPAKDALPALLELALRRPAVSFIWITNASACVAAAVAARNVILLPPGIDGPWLRSLIVKTLHDHRQKQDAREQLEQSAAGIVATLFEVLTISDPYSASIGQRLRYAVDLFCKAAGTELSWEFETAALLAEIGVLTIPARVIAKSQSGQELSGFERDLLAHIPERGADLLQHINPLSLVSKILRYQAKNYDGTGLPNDGIAEDRIPFASRVLKVVSDLFHLKDQGKTQDEAIGEMQEVSHRYDPHLLEIARECFQVNVPSNISGRTQPMTVRELRPGQLLVSDIVTDDGVLLIRDGQVISAKVIHKLRNFVFTSGIREPIYVIDLLASRELTSTFRDLTQSGTAFLVNS